MTVRICGNPRTISNLNCLFSMHNWKWVNLSKMAGFNISLILNERQRAQQKLTSRSVFPFPLLFRRPSTVFFIDSETNETIPLHFRNVFHLFSEKNSLSKAFLLQAAIKGGNFGAKLTHLCGFWLGVSFFSHVKKHRSRFWLDVSFFSCVKTIVHSSDWLELICASKFTTQLFGKYFSVCI